MSLNHPITVLLRLVLVLLATAASLLAHFAPPAEGPVPFRRDRLPLPGEAMIRLSGTLGQLGGMADLQTPAGRRGLAQMLALAVALDPGNREARQHLETAGEGRVPAPGPRPENARPLLDWSWQVVAWLDSPEAGSDGHSLAACLRDVLAPLDPEHPGAAVTLKSGEGGAWHGWVPALAAYQGSRPEPSRRDPAAQAATTDPATPSTLTEATVGTVLWTAAEDGKLVLASVPVTMTLQPVTAAVDEETAADAEGGENLAENAIADLPFSFSLANTEGERALEEMSKRVTDLLQKRHGDSLPKGVRAVLNCGENSDYLTGRNGEAITATAAVLMNAAVTGTQPDAIILGVLTDDGAFQLPTRFWEKLRVLSAAPGGGRLVVPAEAADMLATILALEEPGFFVKYEVLLASNLDELITRASSEPLAASLMFHSLKASGAEGTTPLVESGRATLLRFLSRSSVRQRLAEIVSLAPYHASARLLAVQAAGERPTGLPRHLLAVELIRAIEPVRTLTWPPAQGRISPERAYQVSRDEVDALDRYVDIRDRDLPTRARELAAAARTLGRRGDASLPDGGPAWQTFDGIRRAVLADLRAASLQEEADP